MKLLIYFVPYVCLASSWTDLGSGTLFTNAAIANAGGCTGASGCTSSNYAFTGEFAGRVRAWNGAAIFSNGAKLFMFGGGHDDYLGDEITVIDLVNKSLSNIYSPACFNFASGSSPCAVTALTSDTLSSGAPTSMHTYQGLICVDRHNSCYELASNANGGLVNGNTWVWPIGGTLATQWTNIGRFSGSAAAPNTINCFDNTVVDSADCFYGTSGPQVLYRLNYGTNTWSGIVTSGIPGGPGNSVVDVVFDPYRNQAVFAGGGQVAWVDMTGSDGYTYHDVSSVASATCSAWMGENYPGIQFDPNDHMIVGKGQAGSTIFILNPGTWTCQTDNPLGGPTSVATGSTCTTTGGTPCGLFNRWIYSRTLNAFVTLNDYNQDVFVYQRSYGLGDSTTTCIDRDGDGYGTGPIAAAPLTDLAIVSPASPPVAPSAVAVGTTGSTSYYYYMSICELQQNNNCTAASTVGTHITNANSSLSTLNYVDISWPDTAIPGAGYKILRTTSSTPPIGTGNYTIAYSSTNMCFATSSGTINAPIVTGVNDQLSITIGSGSPQVFTIPGGTTTAAQVVTALAGLTQAIATAVTSTQVAITSTAQYSAADSVTINSVSNNAAAALGFTVGTNTSICDLHDYISTSFPITVGLSASVTSAGHVFTSADLGRSIHITGGTGFTPRYGNTIQAVDPSTHIATMQVNVGLVGSSGGLWQIDGCIGPDADDLDASVHTGAQAITKWGSLKNFYLHEGYSPTNYWWLDPISGNDSNTCHDTNASSASGTPCATFAHIMASGFVAGDMVILRGATYTEALTNPVQGSTNTPSIYVNYPGEWVNITGNTGGQAIGIVQKSWMIFDGMRLLCPNGGYGVSGGTGNYVPSTLFTDIIFRHLEITDCSDGLGAYNGLTNITIENNVIHENHGGTGHGLYIGSRDLPGSNVVVRGNLLYGNDYTGMQFNGVVNNLFVQQNMFYANLLQNLSFENGPSSSFVQSNIFFNGARSGMVFAIYDAYSGSPICDWEPGGICDCTTHAAYCPRDITNNLIENNTFYNGGFDPDGNGDSAAAIDIEEQAYTFPKNVGGNTFRNNIFYQGTAATSTPLFQRWDSSQESTPSAELAWWATDVWDHNIISTLSSVGSPNVIAFFDQGPTHVYTTYVCSTAAGITIFPNGYTVDCKNVDPQFTSAIPTNYAFPASFNFQLLSTSPGVHTGSTTNIYPSDNIGNTYVLASPSLGGLEFQGVGPMYIPNSVSNKIRVGGGVRK